MHCSQVRLSYQVLQNFSKCDPFSKRKPLFFQYDMVSHNLEKVLNFSSHLEFGSRNSVMPGNDIYWPCAKESKESMFYLCILFLKLKYSICIIYMGAALAELCLLGNKTVHSKVGYIGHRCSRLF